jgi:hypothetical protein
MRSRFFYFQRERIAAMAHSHSGEIHAHGTATRQVPFSTAEWEALQASDREAAKHIVCLMGGVFILGLIGYFIIAMIAKGG